MAHINNANPSVITIDACLTKTGRQLLATNPQLFNITKFALSDDQVNYNLWNPNHPLGSEYYGQQIQNMPVLEPIANGELLMKYKLVTMAQNTSVLAVIQVPDLDPTIDNNWPGAPSVTTKIITPYVSIYPNETFAMKIEAETHESLLTAISGLSYENNGSSVSLIPSSFIPSGENSLFIPNFTTATLTKGTIYDTDIILNITIYGNYTGAVSEYILVANYNSTNTIL